MKKKIINVTLFYSFEYEFLDYSLSLRSLPVPTQIGLCQILRKTHRLTVSSKGHVRPAFCLVKRTLVFGQTFAEINMMEMDLPLITHFNFPEPTVAVTPSTDRSRWLRISSDLEPCERLPSADNLRWDKFFKLRRSETSLGNLLIPATHHPPPT